MLQKVEASFYALYYIGCGSFRVWLNTMSTRGIQHSFMCCFALVYSCTCINTDRQIIINLFWRLYMIAELDSTKGCIISFFLTLFSPSLAILALSLPYHSTATNHEGFRRDTRSHCIFSNCCSYYVTGQLNALGALLYIQELTAVYNCLVTAKRVTQSLL